mmetsp:Transcript_31069/g.48660  ORF Transcript_31069/g.48660 Transcript_31069/m.48660 type:complete len:100 (+) Transcript_31069:769-1068(+)
MLSTEADAEVARDKAENLRFEKAKFLSLGSKELKDGAEGPGAEGAGSEELWAEGLRAEGLGQQRSARAEGLRGQEDEGSLGLEAECLVHVTCSFNHLNR